MTDTVEKIYCTDNNSNDAILASLANNSHDPMAMAAMMNNS
jgi:hypothetical protein